MKDNYIYLNRKGKRLNIDTFKRNILMPIAYVLGMITFFAMLWFMFLLAYAFQG